MALDGREARSAVAHDLHRERALPEAREGLAGAVILLGQRRSCPLAGIGGVQRVDGDARVTLAIDRGIYRPRSRL